MTVVTTLRTASVSGGMPLRFGDPEQWRFEWQRRYTRAEWLDQLPTHGGHSRLAPDKLEQLLAGIGAAIDAMGGGFTMHYTTVAVTATRCRVAA